MHRLKIGAAADELIPGAAAAVEKNVHDAARAGRVEGTSLFADQRLETIKPLAFHLFGYLLLMPGRGRAWAGAVFERIGLREADLADEFERRLEFLFRLAGKADDEIGGEGDVRPCRADTLDQTQISFRRVLTVHPVENAIGARLNRKMQIGHELCDLAMG